jgi:hypothetical protein
MRQSRRRLLRTGSPTSKNALRRALVHAEDNKEDDDDHSDGGEALITTLRAEFGLSRRCVEQSIAALPPRVQKRLQHAAAARTNAGNVLRYVMQAFGLSTMQLERMLARYPRVLVLELDTQVQPLCDYLQQELGVRRDALAASLWKRPLFLGTPVKRLQTNVRYLRSLDVSEDKLGTHAMIFPVLFKQTLAHNKRQVAYLRTKLGVRRVGHVLDQQPSVLWYNIEDNLAPSAAFLRSYLGLGEAQLGALVERRPSLLGLSVSSNLKPKLHYLKHTWQLADDAIVDSIAKEPALFSYSILRNYEPTLELLRTAGALLDWHAPYQVRLVMFDRIRRVMPRMALLAAIRQLLPEHNAHWLPPFFTPFALMAPSNAVLSLQLGLPENYVDGEDCSLLQRVIELCEDACGSTGVGGDRSRSTEELTASSFEAQLGFPALVQRVKSWISAEVDDGGQALLQGIHATLSKRNTRRSKHHESTAAAAAVAAKAKASQVEEQGV